MTDKIMIALSFIWVGLIVKLWWTAMLMTTIGSQYWPMTGGGGRLLCFFLSLYSLAVFGYIAAALASFFVEKDKNTGGKS